jgi:hypothetical protein
LKADRSPFIVLPHKTTTGLRCHRIHSLVGRWAIGPRPHILLSQAKMLSRDTTLGCIVAHFLRGVRLLKSDRESSNAWNLRFHVPCNCTVMDRKHLAGACPILPCTHPDSLVVYQEMIGLYPMAASGCHFNCTLDGAAVHMP